MSFYRGSAKATGTDTATVTYASTTGTSLLLGILHQPGSNSSGSLSTVVDSGGNTWVLDGTDPEGGTHGYSFELWRCSNVVTAITSLTVTSLIGPGDDLNVVLGEYLDIAGLDPTDGFFTTGGRPIGFPITQLAQGSTAPPNPTAALNIGFIYGNDSVAFSGPYTGSAERLVSSSDGGSLALQDGSDPLVQISENFSPAITVGIWGLTFLPVLPCDVEATPITLSFTAEVNASNPAPQNVAVANIGGGGDKAFDFSSDATWLLPASGSGTTDDSISVSVDITGLVPGTYTGHLNFLTDSCGSPAVTATLVVTAIPPSPVPSDCVPTPPDAAGPQTWVYDFGTHGWFQLSRGFTALAVFELGDGEQVLVGGAEDGFVYVIDDLNGTFDLSGTCPAASFRPALIDFGDPISMRVFKYLELEFTCDDLAKDITVTFWIDPSNVDNPGTGRKLILTKVRGANRWRGWPQGGALCHRLLIDITVKASANVGAIRGAKIVADKVTGLTT